MTKPYTKNSAIIDIIEDARAEDATKTSYRRIVRALKTLDLDPEINKAILYHLSYTDSDGNVFAWALGKKA